MTEICRTCLEEVSNDSVTFCLNSVDSKTITIGNKLTYCIPEIDLDVVPNAVICNNCFESLTLAHEFKAKCLQIEGRIQSYIEQNGYMLTCINLRDVAQQQKQEADVHENLDIKNLQCEAKDFFDVPKIAQLLAEDANETQPDTCIHKCNKCGFRTVKRQTLIIHMRKHTDEETRRKPYKCLLCEYASSHESNLRCHMRVHLNNGHKKHAKVYKCSFCEYSTTHSKSLNVHLRLHLKTKVYKCMLCQYNSSHKLNFLRHISSHADEKILRCVHCGYETATKSDLQVHMCLHSLDFSSFASERADDNNVAVNNVT